MALPIDILVGRNIRSRRYQKDMTQDQLASRIGISFQQLQKYESGKNRVSASMLAAIAGVLNTPVGYFFGEHQETIGFVDPQLAQLITIFQKLPDNKKKIVMDVVRGL